MISTIVKTIAAAGAILSLLGATPARAEGPASQPASQPASRPWAPAKAKAGKGDNVLPSPASQPWAGDPYRGLDHTGSFKLPPTKIVIPEPSAKPGADRPVPRYDGREPRSASAGETLIWIPRVLFFPAWLVMNYGVRWPLVKLTTLAEEHYVIPKIERFFTFADGRAFLFPTLFFDFGVNPSLGFQFSFKDLWVRNHTLLLQTGVWFNEWLHLVGTSRFKVFRNDEGTVTLRVEHSNRPDRIFAGLNLDNAGDLERFFRQRDTEVELSLRTYLKGLNRVTIGMVFRNLDTSNGDDFDEDESIEAPGSRYLAAPGVIDQAQVPRYGDNYNLLTAQLRIELDSRAPERPFNPGSGLRLELFGTFSLDPSDTDLRFFRWGGEAAAFWDVSGLNHVLALRVYVEAIEKTGDSPIPFTERLILGGDEYLRGFLEGHFRGDSATVATLDYRWPIWIMFDANAFFSVGNVFPGRFEQFNVKRFVASWGLGLRTNTSRDTSFDLMVAFGTNRFDAWDDDFQIDNVRFVFGVNQGF